MVRFLKGSTYSEMQRTDWNTALYVPKCIKRHLQELEEEKDQLRSTPRTWLTSTKEAGQTHQLQVLFVAMVSCIVNSTVTLGIDHRWISTIVQEMLQAAAKSKGAFFGVLSHCQVLTSDQIRPRLTSKTPSPPPHCSRGSRENGGPLWGEGTRTSLC